MQYRSKALTLLSLCILIIPKTIHGHGRLLEPPARNTLWRFGFKAQANYNDNELFCGGIGGITRNAGKCGVCGDPYDGVRLHETGNLMARNETVRNYFPGSSIDLLIEIVANHGGTFNFEICWRDSWDTIETEDCFERLSLSKKKDTLLNSMASMTSATTTNMPEETDDNALDDASDDNSMYTYDLDPSKGTGIYTMSIDLPVNRTCDNCVLRWHWRSANNWGTCDDGSEAIGCGYQEVYRNCADISIKRNGAGIGLGNKRRKRRSSN